MRELAPDTEERNYAKEPLKAKEVKEILAVVPVAEALNTRHKTAKENGWKEKAPSKTAFTKAVVEENNLLKRPILLKGKQYVVGKSEQAIRDLLG